jgi:CRP-like cAMP-binding protein
MIVTEGESADSFYMIVSGTVSVWKDKDKIRNMGEGDSFGE